MEHEAFDRQSEGVDEVFESVVENMEEISRLMALSDSVNNEMLDRVAHLRELGVTWVEIGILQGISSQGAQQWFSRNAGRRLKRDENSTE